MHELGKLSSFDQSCGNTAISYEACDHLEAIEPRPRPVHLLYNRQSRLPLKLRAIIDFVVPRLRERLNDAVI